MTTGDAASPAHDQKAKTEDYREKKARLPRPGKRLQHRRRCILRVTGAMTFHSGESVEPGISEDGTIMSFLQRTTHPDPQATPTPKSSTRPTPPAEHEPHRPEQPTERSRPHSRVGTAWAALFGTVVIAIALIIFMVQNTGSTRIAFLWMSTTTSLAVVLLIGAVGATLLTLILGTARMVQLRHFNRRRHT